MEIIIIGAGIAGLASAIALTKWMNGTPTITVLELRSQPSTIGGAVGLMPNALRSLHHLGVLDTIIEQGYGANVNKIEILNFFTGATSGEIMLTDRDGKGIGTPAFKGLRIMRSDLLQALLKIAHALPNVQIWYGNRTQKIIEGVDKVNVILETGQVISADLLLGCDGMHSVVRTSFIEPTRVPEYTGIANTFGFAELHDTQLAWKDTALCQSHRGSVMCSYFEPSRTRQYASAIMETADVKSREGWLAKGTEQDQIKNVILDRFGRNEIQGLTRVLDATHGWTLYPVYKLSPGGVWCTKRSILLGDAAHAMPPQGESAGIAMEDAIMFARIMAANEGKDLTTRFAMYEKIRRPTIYTAYQEAVSGWETQKDCGWLMFKLREWITGVFLWWTASSRRQRYEKDAATDILELDS